MNKHATTKTRSGEKGDELLSRFVGIYYPKCPPLSNKKIYETLKQDSMTHAQEKIQDTGHRNSL